jgi:hypothetical protein
MTLIDLPARRKAFTNYSYSTVPVQVRTVLVRSAMSRTCSIPVGPATDTAAIDPHRLSLVSKISALKNDFRPFPNIPFFLLFLTLLSSWLTMKTNSSITTKKRYVGFGAMDPSDREDQDLALP